MRQALCITVAVLGSFAWLGAQAPSPAVPEGTTLLVGEVFDAASRAPVASAVVSMSLAETAGRPTALRVLTDARGRFFFNDVGPGSFSVTATKSGWLDGAAGRVRPEGFAVPVDIRDGDRVRQVAIAMWRYGVISGRVMDETKEPTVGAEVRLLRAAFAAGRRHWTYADSAITDDRGMYRFSRLRSGDYVVMVPTTVTSEPDSLRLAAEMPASYYQTMLPIGVAPVRFEAATMPVDKGSLVTSTISLPGSPSASSASLAYATTYYPSMTTIDTAVPISVMSGREQPNVDVTMSLARTFTVSGVLRGPAETSVEFLAVHLIHASSAHHPAVDVATAVTDMNGAFTFFGVPAGQYIARVVRAPTLPPGQRFDLCSGTNQLSYVCIALSAPIDVTAGPLPMPVEALLHADAHLAVTDRPVSGVVLDLRAGPRLSGRVEFRGAVPAFTPADWQRMAVHLDPAGGQVFTAPGGFGFEAVSGGRFSRDGQFSTPSTWPGRYVIRVAGIPQGWTFERATVDGRDVSVVPFEFTRDVSNVAIVLSRDVADITGRVLRDVGSADEAAVVLVFPTDPAAWVDYGRFSRRLAVAPVRGQTYSLRAPPEGEYFLLALRERDLADWRNPEFLQRASALADRMEVRHAQPMSHVLQVRSIQ